jgi:hypothetical protein
MCYDGYAVNCYPNEHTQRFEIMLILMQASIITEIAQINKL